VGEEGRGEATARKVCVGESLFPPASLSLSLSTPLTVVVGGGVGGGGLFSQEYVSTHDGSSPGSRTM